MNNNEQTSSNVTTHQFIKGMNKDLDPMLLGTDSWNHARNAVNNTHDGNLGAIGNEPSNLKVTDLPYDYIGSIFIEGLNKWAIFTTDDINSEIGLFDETLHTYSKIVNSSCLNFSRQHLITGVAKKNFDCSYSIYWDDGFNPSRYLNIDRPIYKVLRYVKNGNCVTPEYSTELDCEALRLSKLMDTPSLKLSKSVNGGTLPNGSYQIAVAYTTNKIRVTDYFTPSNIQTLFTHNNLQSGLILELSNLDTDFEEYEVVVISLVGEKTNCVKFGNYSTKQTRVYIDQLNATLITVPLEYIPLQTPSYEKSDAMYEIADYLLRVGIYTKSDFNYQPLANKIQTKWVALQVPFDYYKKGGNITSYMRDENYIFFIRWIYNDGNKSASYVISGREPNSTDLLGASGEDVFELSDGNQIPNWKVKNTASIKPLEIITSNGKIIAEGDMGYAESTEIYPNDKPAIWVNLCGKRIRLHKFPDDSIIPRSSNDGKYINILGVKFENIEHPIDFNGNPITNIVGYEILRGSREGNKTIIAKGLINNTREYTIPNDITNRKGLYSNYPFNDLRPDPFLSENRVLGGCDGKGFKAQSTYKKDVFTFHSPDTNFKNPFLATYELKVESEDFGQAIGSFSEVFKHPKHKMIRDFALYTSGIVGVGAGLLAIKGDKSTTKQPNQGLVVNAVGVAQFSTQYAEIPATGVPVPLSSYIKGTTTTTSTGGIMQHNKTLAIAGGTFMFTFFLSKGMEESIRLIRNMIPYEQFAYQYNSHGFYNNHLEVKEGNRRRKINNINYLDTHFQEFTDKYRVNNLYRPRTVILELDKELSNPQMEDNSRQTIGDKFLWDNPKQNFSTNISSYYASLKQDLDAQYGQLEGVIQIPITNGVHKTKAELKKKHISDYLFGGDIYINRYTEKNSMFFFYDWLFDQPNGFQFDYNLYNNIPYPRYWINTQDYDVTRLTQPFIKTATGGLVGEALGSLFDTQNSQLGSIVGTIVGAAAGIAISAQDFNAAVLPNDYAHLDRSSQNCYSKISFGIDKSYFYLFNNGVRDFFVESEINIAHRDYNDNEIASRHFDYNEYTDLNTLFRSDIIKAGNNFKYDYSLSASKLLFNYISCGSLLPGSYDPLVAEKCYTYYPNRIIYSLPQQEENKKDNWLAFLANNYKDFSTKITSIKNVHKSGAVIYFKNDSPVMLQGVDQLQTSGGIKITIGDGGLFAQPEQSIVNSDLEYQYGACQNRQSVIGLPHGIFSISQNIGKIFKYSGQGLEEISRNGNKFWFSQYLPSKLLQDFPNFELYDNLLVGVGCLSSYDNTNEILYFSKKDYKLKDSYKNQLTYIGGNEFKYLNRTIYLRDSEYFENASFTVSYDIKNEMFISFHDWIPEAIIGGKNHILTIHNRGIWLHNNRCDSYCNFYNQNYPFELEFARTTGQEVTTLRSLEYILEAYKYSNNCRDKFHVLDENFDKAVVYNSEECSGNLRLFLKSKNNPVSALKYPIITDSSIHILYSKEENKYRFNQFWDIIKDRGEFSNSEKPIWNIEPNGYIKNLNSSALNYSKQSFQRKKFRHYTNTLLLRKEISNNTKLILKLVNTKEQKSFR